MRTQLTRFRIDDLKFFLNADGEPVIVRLREAARAATVDARFMAALATVETPIQYMDAPELQRFWDADAKKLGDVVRRVGKLE